MPNLSPLHGKNISLVLSGGIVRAASWHTGVAMGLEELGFNFYTAAHKNLRTSLDIKTYVGSSAGAMICCLLASGFSPSEIIQSYLGEKSRLKRLGHSDIMTLRRHKIKTLRPDFFNPLESFPFGIRHILKPIFNTAGFFSTAGLKKYLEEHVLISNNFEDYKDLDLFIVATQLDHSRKVIFSKHSYPNPGHDSTACYYTGTKISDAACSSMSVPPFYTPYPIKNEYTDEIDYYIDGEIRETLSTHIAVDNDCEVIISSWTHTPYHFHDEIGSLKHYGMAAIATQALYLMIQKKIVSSRADYARTKDLIDTIYSYVKSEGFSDKQTKEIIHIIEAKLHYKENLIFIDIYPEHHDYKTFFANPFSLERKVTEGIVKTAFKQTIKRFSNLNL